MADTVTVTLEGPLWDAAGDRRERTLQVAEPVTTTAALLERILAQHPDIERDVTTRGRVDSSLCLIVGDESYNVHHDTDRELDLDEHGSVVLLLINTWSGG